MTKKQFEKLARALLNSKPAKGAILYQWKDDVEAVANVCASENSRFDYNKFLKACGVEVGD